MSDTLTINPASMKVLATGSAACFTLTNNGADRLAFKIKCSNGTLYTFKRIVGFLEVSQTKEIHMIRANGPPGEAKIVVLYLPAPAGSPPPMQLFAKAGPKTSTATLPVAAVPGNTTPPASPTPAAAPAPEEGNPTSFVGQTQANNGNDAGNEQGGANDQGAPTKKKQCILM
ncbi:hypothetical protein L596_013103 [Steinernema carpocapsae]|nr:hypothetical protein L596_013103 [Steinernema carpocapsae]